MKRNFSTAVLFLILFVLLNPAIASEEEVLSRLKDYENAYNTKNVEQVINLWSQDAKIMTGRDRKLVSRDDYRNMLPERMQSVPTMYFQSPRIESIAESEATVTSNVKMPKSTAQMTIKLVKAGGAWYLQSWQY
jgi:hypothetical protein